MLVKKVKFEETLIIISLSNQNNISEYIEKIVEEKFCFDTKKIVFDLFINTLSEQKRFLVIDVIDGKLDEDSMSFRNVSDCVKTISNAVFKEYRSSLENQIFPPKLRALFFDDINKDSCNLHN